MKIWNEETRDNPKVWDNKMSICRDDYSPADYRKAYRDCIKHYDFKRRVYHGWIFFSFSTDAETYDRQR